ncbi:VWA domain-containing protein [bacterium]|nr:VWA domain-containing protein [bacterium]
MSNQIKKRKVIKGGTFGYEEKNKTKICREIADIFEQLHGDKIEINTGSKCDNMITEWTSTDQNDKEITNYRIDVSKSPTRSTKTGLEDSLTHIITKSPRKSYEDNKDDFIDFSSENHYSKVSMMSDKIFDAFENKRAETWSTAIYQGYKERVTEANKLDGEKLIKKIENPIDALNAARLGLTEMVADSEFPEANDFMKSVERTMPKASVLLTKDYIDRVLKPWYQKITSEDEPENEPNPEEEGEDEGEGQPQGEGNPAPNGEQQGEGQGEGEGEGEGKPEPKWKSDKPSEAQKRYIKKLGGEPKFPETKGQASDYIKELIDGNDPAKEERAKQLDKSNPNAEDKLHEAMFSDISDINQNNTGSGCDPNVDFDNDTIEQQQQEGEKEIEKIEEKISDMLQNTKQVKKYDIQNNIKHGTSRCIDDEPLPKSSVVEYDRTTVNKLKQLFKRLKSKQTHELSDSGTDIDVELFIKNQVEGGHDFLLNEVEQRGFAVVIGVDESGSMGNGNMHSAKKLCATLYKAFEDMPNVDIYVFGWTTGYSEETDRSGVIIKKITKFEEVGSLQASGGTPFLEATYYLADFVDKLPHRKKLMFQITDGDIYHDNALQHYFNKLRKSKIGVTGIQISSFKSQSMIDLFGKQNYIQTPSMDRINGTMTKNIVKQFMGTVQ